MRVSVTRSRIACAIVGVALVGAGTVAAAATAAAANGGKLVALVADPLKITLTQDGRAVHRLKPGTYTILVKDTAPDHDFHLSGPGVNKRTSVSGKGTFTWKVTLGKGTYTFLCDPHLDFMRGSFVVS